MKRSLISGLGIGIASIAIMVGCSKIPITREEVSETMYENGKVVETMYNPSSHSTDLAPTMDIDGNVGVSITSSSVPETYGVVFRCEHGNKFAIQGSEDRYKDLWNRLDVGDNVVIEYKEQYRVRYEDTDGDGEREVTERILYDFDFINAEKVPAPEKAEFDF